MPTLGDLPSHAAAFLLVLFRLSGLFVFAPLLSSSMIPARARALLCAAFAVALYPALPAAPAAPVSLDLFSLGLAVLGETLVGAAIGLIAALPLFAVQLGGLVISQQAGLALGQIYNPLLDTESDVFGQFLQYAALVIFIAMGGLDLLFLSTARTFLSVPPGAAWGLFSGAGAHAMSPAPLLSGLVASGFELALRVAAPVLCIILIETVASSLVAKTIPQINTQSIGFAVKVLVTLLAMIAGAAAILHAARSDLLGGLQASDAWAGSLTTRPAFAGAGSPSPAPVGVPGFSDEQWGGGGVTDGR